jgi:hypothetical protein
LIDQLSPSFVKVLTPGSAYTGGRKFFDERGGDLIEIIPAADIQDVKDGEVPPPSLKSAMREYFIGVALGVLDGDSDTEGKNRSMLVHPAQQTDRHQQLYTWVMEIKDLWHRVLTRGQSYELYDQLLNEFKSAYDDLTKTANVLHDFEKVVEQLAHIISTTQVHQVNSKWPSNIDWEQDYSNILVGGNKLDRGYTVEGLTVTYMPRSLGAAQADTIQQRARWFGYKEDYLGLCRVYLSGEARHAYLTYVEHEEQFRSDLRKFSLTNQPLSEWKRAFFLEPELKPTRSQVLKDGYKRGRYSKSWYETKYPHADSAIVTRNRNVIDDWITKNSKPIADGETVYGHKVIKGYSVKELFEGVLTRLSFGNSLDSSNLTGLNLQIRSWLEEHEDSECRIYLMSNHAEKRRARSQDSDGKIPELHQGYTPKGAPPEKRTYPGDSAMKLDDQISVQIHRIDVTDSRGGPVITSDVIALAIWVPSDVGNHWVAQ